MNNIEKILKKNKEVVAIVILLVLVWMMVRKGGYISTNHNFGYLKFQRNNDNNRAAVCRPSGWGKEVECNTKENIDNKTTEDNSFLFEQGNNNNIKIKSLENGKWCKVTGDNNQLECDLDTPNSGRNFRISNSGQMHILKGGKKKWCEVDVDGKWSPIYCNKDKRTSSNNDTRGSGSPHLYWYSMINSQY